MIKVQNITSKGQITLPSAWRKAFPGSQIMLEVKDSKIQISPINVSEDKEYYTVFDAIRDNSGKGIPAKDILKMLQK